ncbi:MAG: hypothetical protein K6U04_09630 [Armatimonadetes bacterium]|nr:hypothetical protein [Armatimonadota bacterium]
MQQYCNFRGVVIILFVALFLVSCNNSKTEIKRVEMPMARPGANGVSFGLYDTNGNIETTKVFNIKKGEEFSKIISISNYINNTRKYLIIALVDCIQVPFRVNDKEYINYTFSMNANEVTEIPVCIDSLKPGFHDIIFLIFKSPEITMESQDLALANSLAQIYPIRFNIIVESGEPFKPKLTEIEPIKVFNEANIHGAFLTNTSERMKVWYVEKTENKEIPYYIHIGNQETESHYFAIITLLDWKQVPINKNGKVLFLELKPNEKRVYKGLLHLPENLEKGKKLNLTLVSISEPFSLQEKHTDLVEQSLRTTITPCY